MPRHRVLKESRDLLLHAPALISIAHYVLCHSRVLPPAAAIHSTAHVHVQRTSEGSVLERAPLSQVYDVVRDIRAGTFKNHKGRPIDGASKEAPAFCYVVCDINEKVERGAVDAGGQLTPDGRGHFGWNSQLKLYFEVISYEKLIGDALRRNRMLFKKLGLPIGRLGEDDGEP
jgi:hypothetical protein